MAHRLGQGSSAMESRADRYRRLATDDQLRALRTNDPSQKRAFEEAAREWLTLADDVERMENAQGRFGRLWQTRRITQIRTCRWTFSVQVVGGSRAWRYCCLSVVGLGVAERGSASCSALSGSIRPEPKLSSRSPGASRRALAVRMRRMSAGVSFGLRSSSSATMPLTSAAATDVPVVSW